MSTTAINYPELIQLAAEAGCHETFVGVETLDEENLASVHKKFNKVEQYAQLFTSLRKVGILGQASMIFGFDNDTPASLRKTIDVVMNWDINYLYVSILTPLPGTPFYDRMKRDGRIIDDDWSNYDCNHCVIQPKQMSPRELTDLVWEAYERFYSVKGIVDRLWRFKREYVKFFPRDMALEELFFQIYCHRAVNSKQHPFSLGLNRESPV